MHPAQLFRQPFEPLAHACPRCLGEVAWSGVGYDCVEHGDARDGHGPYRVDELLGPTAQREAALNRSRLARRTRARRTPASSSPCRVPDLPDLTPRGPIAAAMCGDDLASWRAS